MLVALVSILGTSSMAVDPVPPVRGTVVQRFVAPRCQRCAGHRGVTIQTVPGDSVVAVTDGVVTFSGRVGGRHFLVERIAPGVRVTYGWIAAVDSTLTEGAPVRVGQVLGLVGRSMYLGVRVGDVYVEPLSYLGFWRPRLVGPGRAVVGSRAPSR